MLDNVSSIIIPAREGSKGVKHKNRFLLNFTLDELPKDILSKVIVSTDDNDIKDKVRRHSEKIRIHDRSYESSTDGAPVSHCVEEALMYYEPNPESDVIVLYLTYPERTYSDIVQIYEWYIKNNFKSLLCRGDIDPHAHPYLCFIDNEDGTGVPLINHNLYRRQEYPKCFHVSHFISMFRVSEFDSLNHQLYNTETGFYTLDKKSDIDTHDDLRQFLKEAN